MQRDHLTQAIFDIIGPELLAKAWQKDEVANGVQIRGQDRVTKVALGVSLNLAFLEAAVQWGAEYCIFHHGLDPRTYLSRLPTYLQKELQLIFDHHLTVAGFHYALDAHPVIGNNAQIIKALGASLGESLYDEWGYVGHFQQKHALTTLQKRCQRLFSHPVLAFEGGPKDIRTVGVVSGAAKPYAAELNELEQKGVQLYISGETSESVPHKLTESGINYFVCGHYATETFGVKALGEKLKERFAADLEIQFIDISSSI